MILFYFFFNKEEVYHRFFSLARPITTVKFIGQCEELTPFAITCLPYSPSHLFIFLLLILAFNEKNELFSLKLFSSISQYFISIRCSCVIFNIIAWGRWFVKYITNGRPHDVGLSLRSYIDLWRRKLFFCLSRKKLMQKQSWGSVSDFVHTSSVE